MLQYEGAVVKAYDPVAMPGAAQENPELQLAEDPYDLAKELDAIVVCTEWNEFKQLDLDRIKYAMRTARHRGRTQYLRAAHDAEARLHLSRRRPGSNLRK